GLEMLRSRLVRRGFVLSTGALTMALIDNAATAAVPTRLLGNTTKAAVAYATKQAAAAGLVSAKVVALASGMVRTMVFTTMQIATKSAPCLLMRAAFSAQASRPLAHNIPLATAQKAAPAEKKKPTATDNKGVRKDRYDDPLPAGALARLGTIRWRHGDVVTFLA